MAIVVTFNGSPVTSEGFCQGQDHPIGSGEATDTVALSSVAAISVTNIEVSLWSERVIFTHGQTFPFSLSGGTPLNCTIGSKNPPLLFPGTPLSGAPTGLVTISYIDEAAIARTFRFYYAVRMVDASLDENDFPSEAEWLDEWLFDGWAFASALAGPTNLLGLGFGMENPAGGGLLAWKNTYLPTFIAQGGVNVLMHGWQGRLHLVIPGVPGDIMFEAWKYARTWGDANGQTQIYATHEAALDAMIADGLRPWVYMGTPRRSIDFAGLRGQPLKIAKLLLDCTSFSLRRAMGLMFDSPENHADSPTPEITVGEQRYESLLFLQWMQTQKSIASYIEPRTGTAETQWYAAAGWARLMVDRAYWIANPAYFSSTGTLTDANMGLPVARWIIDGNNKTLPFKLAHLIHEGHQAIAGVAFNWCNQGGTLTNLYDWVRYHFRVIRGVTLEIPPSDEAPATPAPLFETDPDSFASSVVP